MLGLGNATDPYLHAWLLLRIVKLVCVLSPPLCPRSYVEAETIKWRIGPPAIRKSSVTLPSRAKSLSPRPSHRIHLAPRLVNYIKRGLLFLVLSTQGVPGDYLISNCHYKFSDAVRQLPINANDPYASPSSPHSTVSHSLRRLILIPPPISNFQHSSLTSVHATNPTATGIANATEVSRCRSRRATAKKERRGLHQASRERFHGTQTVEESLAGRGAALGRPRERE